jgi:hypothetical protein
MKATVIVMLSAVMLSVIMLSVIMLSVIMLSVIMLSVIMLCAIILSVVMLSVVMLNVVAPFQLALFCKLLTKQEEMTAISGHPTGRKCLAWFWDIFSKLIKIAFSIGSLPSFR